MLAACGAESGLDGDQAPATQQIAIHAPGAALIAAREIDGDWQKLSPDAAGDVTAVLLEGPFEVAVGCQIRHRFDVRRGGPGLAQIDLPCTRPAPIAVTFEGSSLLDVEIANEELLDENQLATAGQTLTLPPGTYDMMVTDRSFDRLAIELRRAVVLQEATTLVLEPQGLGGEPVRASFAFGPRELPCTGSIVGTERGTLTYDSSCTTSTVSEALRIPFAAIDSTRERRLVEAGIVELGDNGRATGRTRFARKPDPGGSVVPFELGDYVEVTETELVPAPSATWTSATAYDDLELAVFGESTPRWTLRVAPEWIAAGGPTVPLAFPDPTEIPGWPAALDLPAAGELRGRVVARGADGEVELQSATGFQAR